MSLKLNAKKRDLQIDVNELRASGKIPAVFYGSKTESTPITVDKKEFIKIFRETGETTLLSLVVDGKEESVLVHEVILNPVSDEVYHIDFYVVDKSKKVTVAIPLEFIGESLAIKNLGGTLVKVMHELEVEGLPDKLPRSIEIDISSLLTLESTISVENIKLPEGVEATLDDVDTIASISLQKEEEEESVEADLSSIEVEKKGKEEDPETSETKE